MDIPWFFFYKTNPREWNIWLHQRGGHELMKVHIYVEYNNTGLFSEIMAS